MINKVNLVTVSFCFRTSLLVVWVTVRIKENRRRNHEDLFPRFGDYKPDNSLPVIQSGKSICVWIDKKKFPIGAVSSYVILCKNILKFKLFPSYDAGKLNSTVRCFYSLSAYEGREIKWSQCKF